MHVLFVQRLHFNIDIIEDFVNEIIAVVCPSHNFLNS
jgi:hypothetical protein